MDIAPTTYVRRLLAYPFKSKTKRISEEEIEKALDRHCEPPWDKQLEKRNRLSAATIRNIRNLISQYDDPFKQQEWSKRPRIFTILRIIERLDAMSTFVESKLFDEMLPFSEHELPLCLGGSRPAFVRAQDLCLTEAIELEKGPDGKHVQFNENADIHFVKQRDLGGGGFGRVDHVWSRLSLKHFARKKFPRSWNAEQTRKQYEWFEREIRPLKKLKHHHVVRIKGTYADTTCFAILMQPIADCNLQEYLSHFEADQLVNLRYFYGCLASALTYLHYEKVYHMDIKLANILVKGHQIYITDFGAAHDWSQRDRSTTWAALPLTSSYMAPEQVADPNAPKNYAIDIWALGVVFLEMTTVLRGLRYKQMQLYLSNHGSKGEYVYNNSLGTTKWMERLRSMDGPKTDNLPLIWIKDMLARDPQKRPYGRQIQGQILESHVFYDTCCASDGDFWSDPHIIEGDPTDPSDEGSIAEFMDAEELLPGAPKLETNMNPEARSTIRSWFNQVEAAHVQENTFEVRHEELAFEIEDDDDDHNDANNEPGAVKSASNLVEVLQDVIPPRLQNIELFAEVRNLQSTSGGDDDVFLFDVESDATSLLATEKSVPFDIDSDRSSSSGSPPLLPLHDVSVLDGAVIPGHSLESLQYSSGAETIDNSVEKLEIVEEEDVTTDMLSQSSTTAVSCATNLSRASADRPTPISTQATLLYNSKMQICEEGSEYVDDLDVERLRYVRRRMDTSDSNRNRTENLLYEKFVANHVGQSQASVDADLSCTRKGASFKGSSNQHTKEEISAPNNLTKEAFLPATTPLTTKNLRLLSEELQTDIPDNVIKTSRQLRLGKRWSVKKYIQQACKPPDIEIATTVMSERKKAELKRLVFAKSMNRSLHLLDTYVRAGGVQAVRILLNSGCNPGTKAKPDPGPLSTAIKGKSLRHNKCADALLKAGANPNASISKNGKSMLALAIQNDYFHGYQGLIWTLLHWGANPNIKDRHGETPLVHILYGGYNPLEEHKRQALALILNQSKFPTNVNIEPLGTLNMPLHLAARRKDPWAVGILLENGAQPNASNAAGQTPFAVTVGTWTNDMTKDHKEVARLLLAWGADPNEPLGAKKAPALLSAIKHGQPDLVELLIRYGADPFKADTDAQNAYMACYMKLGGGISRDLVTEMWSLLDLHQDTSWDSDKSSC